MSMNGNAGVFQNPRKLVHIVIEKSSTEVCHLHRNVIVLNYFIMCVLLDYASLVQYDRMCGIRLSTCNYRRSELYPCIKIKLKGAVWDSSNR